MESAKLNVVHFNSEDVIATSGIISYNGEYQGSKIYVDGSPAYSQGWNYYYKYSTYSNNLDHSDPGTCNGESGLSTRAEYQLDNEPFIPGEDSFIGGIWYDEFYDWDTKIRYFYTAQ